MPLQVIDQHIESTPDIAGGKPRIAGHRITVQDIVIWHQHMGKSVDEICTGYDLGPADVHAALAFYFDNRAEIDKAIDDSDAFIETLRKSTPSVLENRLKNRFEPGRKKATG